ncbi:MAG: hypothetical protein R3C25_10200 [Hyphomonadaceae bacterium]
MSRPYLTAREYQCMLDAQNGVCCVKGCGSDKDLIAEHSTPLAFYWGKPDQLMCSVCHKAKTLKDIKAIWKAKRLSGEVLSQYERRRRYGPKLRSRYSWGQR